MTNELEKLEYEVGELLNKFSPDEVKNALENVLADREREMEDHLRGDVDYQCNCEV